MIDTIELTEEEKDRASARNGWAKDRRNDKIKAGVKKIYSLEDELAITRKMLQRVFDLVVELHEKEIADEVIAEFKQYFEDVERVKEEVDGT